MGGKVLELESERLKAAGIQEGMIAGAIKTCKKFKLDQEAAVKNVIEEFFLSEKDAINYVKKYWQYIMYSISYEKKMPGKEQVILWEEKCWNCCFEV